MFTLFPHQISVHDSQRPKRRCIIDSTSFTFSVYSFTQIKYSLAASYGLHHGKHKIKIKCCIIQNLHSINFWIPGNAPHITFKSLPLKYHQRRSGTWNAASVATLRPFQIDFWRRVMRKCNAANIVTGASKGNIIQGWCDPPDLNTTEGLMIKLHTEIKQGRIRPSALTGEELRRIHQTQSRGNWSQLWTSIHSWVFFLKPPLKKKRVSALQ